MLSQAKAVFNAGKLSAEERQEFMREISMIIEDAERREKEVIKSP